MVLEAVHQIDIGILDVSCAYLGSPEAPVMVLQVIVKSHPDNSGSLIIPTSNAWL